MALDGVASATTGVGRRLASAALMTCAESSDAPSGHNMRTIHWSSTVGARTSTTSRLGERAINRSQVVSRVVRASCPCNRNSTANPAAR